MRILVITRNAWDDTNSIGNTLSNFFGGINDIEFAAVYFRSAMPQNELCKNYYQSSEIDIIRNWFMSERIGKHFVKNAEDKTRREGIVEKKEKTIVRIIQKCGIELAYKLSDYLWYSEKWINDNFRKFIESFAPDLMVSFVKSAPQYYLTIKYLRENYRIPLFSWIADDEYTVLLKKHAQKEIHNLQYILNESAVVRGCSVDLCKYYNAVFGCKAEPLYKGCDLSIPMKATVGHPIVIVYAGNLLYGRIDILRQIADVVDGFARCGLEVSFEIYSNTPLLPKEIKAYFGNGCATKYFGKRDYSVIKQRLAEADVVLHVESFEPDQILKTKYSFSTKIIDYLQSGSVLLAVGPREVASMRYIQRIPGTCTIHNLERVHTELEALLMDSSHFYQRALEIRAFAQRYHNAPAVATELAEQFHKIIVGAV